MTTILFDIDGTLCDTVAADGAYFLSACSDVIGCDVSGSRWTTAPQISDSGVMQWLWLQHHHRLPSTEEEHAVTEKFIKLLQLAIATLPNQFRAIPGAVELLHHPPEDWHLAAATGGWRQAALLKLRAAGLPEGILMASSTDSPDRVAIFRLGAKRAAECGGRSHPVVLVGDGVWDVQVARVLGWPFVGIGWGARAERLRRAGAQMVVRDFTDLSVFRAAVEASRVPAVSAEDVS